MNEKAPFVRGGLDLVGHRFGSLTVIRQTGARGSNREWECLCDCGKTTKTTTNLLRTKRASSCGQHGSYSELNAAEINADAFHKKAKAQPSGCIEWSGERCAKGYGIVYVNDKRRRAHRVAWVLHHGCVPRNALVCHRCDNPSCVNVDHLFIGSARDNIHDMVTKGRASRPKHGRENNPSAKLTAEKVIEMRVARSAGESFASIAQRYGVSREGARLAIIGQSWGVP